MLCMVAVACSSSSVTNGVEAEDGLLRLIVMVSRHGVRAPVAEFNTTAPTAASEYASRTWPVWPVKDGDLTPHGRELAVRLGEYYRLFYLPQLGFESTPGSECPPKDWITVVPDSIQRDEETAEGFLRGLLPGCSVEIQKLPSPNALYQPQKVIKEYPGEEARSAVLARIGRIEDMQTELAEPLKKIQDVLDCCQPPACGGQATCDLETLPSGFNKSGMFFGTLFVGLSASETFLMEYAQGMPASDVGWGEVDLHDILEMLPVQNQVMSVLESTDGPAQAYGSNITAHVLGSLEQAVTGSDVEGVTGSPQARVVGYFAHDGTIANVAGTLKLRWDSPDVLENGTPPCGALVFELHESLDGEHSVQLWFVTQTLDQMRSGAELTLEEPPLRLPVTMESCGSESDVQECSYDDFAELVKTRINTEYVDPELALDGVAQ